MPPKNEKKDEKQVNQPKVKNFFDMEDDDEDVVAEEPAVKNNTINKDRLKELGANMRDLFHERGEDDLFAQEEEKPVEINAERKTEQSTVDRKQELQQEHPHLFYDGGTALNDQIKGAETQPEQIAPEQPAQAPVEEPTNTNKKKSIFGDDELDEEEDTLVYANNLDALKGSIKTPQPDITPREAREKLRNNVLMNNAIHATEEELRDADTMVEGENVLGAKTQDNLQTTKKRSIFGDDELDEEEDTLVYANNLDALKGSIKAPRTQTTNNDALNKLRNEVLTSKATRITKEELLNSDGIVTVEDVFGPQKDEKVEKTDPKPEEKKPEIAKINDSANIAVFVNKLNTFNNMYKLNIDANDFAYSVSESWTMMKSGDDKKKAEGKQMMGNLFKDTLKKAFDIEKSLAYDEHRLPDYNEIIKSSNDLVRAAMFGFTDLYHDPKSAALFEPTAFGGMSAKEMAELTSGDSLWSMDQKSHKAWDIQSKEAKSIANKWLGEDRPYETLINEMNGLVEANKKGIVDRKELLNKLAAAEWMLVSNEKMMVENPEDPINPIPNWGNRYWKALTSARESLGIDKHISMRELIQGEYAESAKAVNSVAYNETQINDYVLDPEARAIYDSMDIQKEQFATQSAAVILTEEPKPQLKPEDPDPELKLENTKENTKEKTARELMMEELRVRISVRSQDQREIMKNEPKDYSSMVIETEAPKLEGPQQGGKL